MSSINLKKYRDAFEAKDREVVEMEEKLTSLRSSLNELRGHQTSELRELIKQGSSTGDLLTDGIIKAFGFDVRALDPLMTFNKRLIDRKGQECLVLAAWRRHTYTNHPDQDRHSSPEVGCVFGKLTGESLLVETKDHPSFFTQHISFPFDGYVKSGMEDQQQEKRFPGRYLTGSSFNDSVNTSSFALFLMGTFGVERGENKEYLVLIGDEIEALKKTRLSFGGVTLFYEMILGLRDTLLTAPIGGQRELIPMT